MRRKVPTDRKLTILHPTSLNMLDDPVLKKIMEDAFKTADLKANKDFRITRTEWTTGTAGPFSVAMFVVNMARVF